MSDLSQSELKILRLVCEYISICLYFPGKKAASSSGDGSAPDDSSRYMQEINMGFDRLVAMANEVDKRRKSAENSPVQGQSGNTQL